MRITLIYVGKTDEKYLNDGMDKYRKRLVHYTKFQEILIPDIKNAKSLSEEQQRNKEGVAILKSLASSDTLILLDEHGKAYSSVEFAGFFDQAITGNLQHLVFAIGGPYGFSEEVYQRANEKISLSKMTFSHQMVRLFFIEQLYRAHTILRREPYHHV